jgi:hypothetical protein
MQCRPVERERRVDHGLDVGGAGIAIAVPGVLGQWACHFTPLPSTKRVFERLTGRLLSELIAVRCGTRKDILLFLHTAWFIWPPYHVSVIYFFRLSNSSLICSGCQTNAALNCRKDKIALFNPLECFNAVIPLYSLFPVSHESSDGSQTGGEKISAPGIEKGSPNVGHL